MQVIYKKHVIDVKRGTEVRNLLSEEIRKSKIPVIACRFNNEVKALNYPINSNGEIELIDISTKDGMRIYTRGLIYIIAKAFHEEYKEAWLTVNWQYGSNRRNDFKNK